MPANPTAPRTPEPVDLAVMSVEELRRDIRMCMSDWGIAMAGLKVNELCRRALAAERGNEVAEARWVALRQGYVDGWRECEDVQELKFSINVVHAKRDARYATREVFLTAAARIRALGQEKTK